MPLITRDVLLLKMSMNVLNSCRVTCMYNTRAIIAKTLKSLTQFLGMMHILLSLVNLTFNFAHFQFPTVGTEVYIFGYSAVCRIE